MADFKLNWDGDNFLDKFHKEQVKNLTRAAIYLTNEIKKEISVAIVKEGKVVTERSAEGEPPRKQYGELRRSITWVIDADKLVAYVGTNKIYGKYLELGTSLMAKRPFLRATLIKRMNTLKKIMAGGKFKKGE